MSRRTLFALAFALLLTLGWFGRPVFHWMYLISRGHLTTRYESALLRAGQISRDPRFCDKISPLSYYVLGFNPAGQKLQLPRSTCFSEVAILKGDPGSPIQLSPEDLGLLGFDEADLKAIRDSNPSVFNGIEGDPGEVNYRIRDLIAKDPGKYLLPKLARLLESSP